MPLHKSSQSTGNLTVDTTPITLHQWVWCCTVLLTCLKVSMMSLLSSMSLNMPSNLDVKPAPHSCFNLLSIDFSASTLADLPRSSRLARSCDAESRKVWWLNRSGQTDKKPAPEGGHKTNLDAERQRGGNLPLKYERYMQCSMWNWRQYCTHTLTQKTLIPNKDDVTFAMESGWGMTHQSQNWQ